jgi:hypothetical protein
MQVKTSPLILLHEWRGKRHAQPLLFRISFYFSETQLNVGLSFKSLGLFPSQEGRIEDTLIFKKPGWDAEQRTEP